MPLFLIEVFFVVLSGLASIFEFLVFGYPNFEKNL